jgi:FkbM family methyltransferase
MKALLRRAKARLQGLTRARRRGPYLIASNDYGLYCLPRRALHRPACQAILRGRVWEAETLKFLIDNAAGDIVHGGTFFGDFLPALSGAYDRVWAFEPNPDSSKCADITIRLNELTNVELRNSGIGAASASVSLQTERDGVYLGGGSFVVDKPGDVRLEAIDDILPYDRHVGMIHFDVEGYEGPALAGARKTIERCRPILVLENLPGPIEGYEVRMRLNDNHILFPLTNSRP